MEFSLRVDGCESFIPFSLALNRPQDIDSTGFIGLYIEGSQFRSEQVESGFDGKYQAPWKMIIAYSLGNGS
jgi:hypothetical protein